jgi:hypothetical protein
VKPAKIGGAELIHHGHILPATYTGVGFAVAGQVLPCERRLEITYNS